jgi:hypothetical protein
MRPDDAFLHETQLRELAGYLRGRMAAAR